MAGPGWWGPCPNRGAGARSDAAGLFAYLAVPAADARLEPEPPRDDEPLDEPEDDEEEPEPASVEELEPPEDADSFDPPSFDGVEAFSEEDDPSPEEELSEDDDSEPEDSDPFECEEVPEPARESLR
ncbi:MAG: hypothetical protein WA892_08535 [Ornithinimicrobium sp.]